MYNKQLSDKTHPYRITYTKFSIKCPFCVELQGKSKLFGSLYQLLYHLNVHDGLDEKTAGISKGEIKKIVKNLSHALKYGMFLQ